MSEVNLIQSSSKPRVTFEYLGFSFDCQTEEAHSSTLSHTENPIEGGAVSTDHATVQPKSVTVSGIILAYDPGGSSSDTRLKDMYKKLTDLQARREKATVKTKMMTYENMLLSGIMAITSAEEKADLALVFTEIKVSSVETVSGLVVQVPESTAKKGSAQATKPDGKKKAEKSAQQSSKPATKGKTQPQEDKKKKSVLKGVFG